MLRHGAADALCCDVNYCSVFMTRAGAGLPGHRRPEPV